MTEERKAELRAAAAQLGRWLTQTPEGRDVQAGSDAIARENFAQIDAAEARHAAKRS